ncbi:hypothetical protein HanPSC8_Chr04g0165401 [Helianthus annuus]|nr:hypothetical protein HanPSC8_Chr04g0165401 [Helianthus annuus]
MSPRQFHCLPFWAQELCQVFNKNLCIRPDKTCKSFCLLLAYYNICEEPAGGAGGDAGTSGTK